MHNEGQAKIVGEKNCQLRIEFKDEDQAKPIYESHSLPKSPFLGNNFEYNNFEKSNFWNLSHTFI